MKMGAIPLQCLHIQDLLDKAGKIVERNRMTHLQPQEAYDAPVAPAGIAFDFAELCGILTNTMLRAQAIHTFVSQINLAEGCLEEKKP